MLFSLRAVVTQVVEEENKLEAGTDHHAHRRQNILFLFLFLLTLLDDSMNSGIIHHGTFQSKSLLE
jgi:hypothetical protein